MLASVNGDSWNFTLRMGTHSLEQSVRDGMLWVVSTDQERRNSRQFLHEETMSRDLTLGPHEQHSKRSVEIVALPVYGVLLVYTSTTEMETVSLSTNYFNLWVRSFSCTIGASGIHVGAIT